MKKMTEIDLDLVQAMRADGVHDSFPRHTRDSRTTTLHEAKVWLAKKMEDGAVCPCCGQVAKIYKRKLNSSMAFVLLLIDRNGAPEWIHVNRFINMRVKDPAVAAAVRGDYPKLTYWGLLERFVGKREDGSSRNGYYRITKRGRMFARNKLRVPKHIWFYNDNALDREDTETVSVVDALGDNFDYSELMVAR